MIGKPFGVDGSTIGFNECPFPSLVFSDNAAAADFEFRFLKVF